MAPPTTPTQEETESGVPTSLRTLAERGGGANVASGSRWRRSAWKSSEKGAFRLRPALVLSESLVSSAPPTLLALAGRDTGHHTHSFQQRNRQKRPGDQRSQSLTTANVYV